jgi:TatD DNase family protein
MSVHFIDTHCHFDFPPFTDHEEESLALAVQAGVQQIIVPTVTADRFEQVLNLAHSYPALYAAVGLHPLYIAQHSDEHMAQLATILANKPQKLVAVGEIGLDLYMENPQFERQLELLNAQLKLAKQHDLPVILHSRRSHDRLAGVLRRADVPCCGAWFCWQFVAGAGVYPLGLLHWCGWNHQL